MKHSAKSAITLDQLRSAFHDGGLRSISLTGTGGMFYVTANPRRGARVTLATTPGEETSCFCNPLKAIAILHEIGVHKVEIDTSAWTLATAEPEVRKRPDVAEHDTWFRREVEAALEEANSPRAKWVSQDEAKRQTSARRLAWRAKA